MSRLNKITTSLLFALAFAGFSTLTAQPMGGGMGRMRMMDQDHMAGRGVMGQRMEIPDLTDAQKSKIEDLHLKYAKQEKPVTDQLEEKRVKFHNIMTSDNISKTDAYKLTEEMADLQLKMRKLHVDKRIEMSQILTEKQRLFINSKREHRRGFGMGMGF